VIMISVEMESPELAALIANRIASQYIDRSVRERSETARAAATWLGERTAELREQLETAEARVEEMRVTQLDEDGVSLEAISQQQLQLNTQLAVAQVNVAIGTRFGQPKVKVVDVRRAKTQPPVPPIARRSNNLKAQPPSAARISAIEVGPDRRETGGKLRRCDLRLGQCTGGIVKGLQVAGELDFPLRPGRFIEPQRRR